jgi:hypothetical protein
MADHGKQDEQVAELLEHIRRKGVDLWTEDNRVHFKGPRGALAPADIERLKRCRQQILKLLRPPTTSVTGYSDAPSGPVSAPVSFSQLAQWNRENLAKRPGVRSISSVTRLLGRLDVNALRRSICEVARRHQTLRTRIVPRDGDPIQEIHEAPVMDHLMEVPAPPAESDPAEFTLRLIRHLVLAPVDVGIGPLFATQLLKLCDEEHVLIMTMEHIISDNLSKNVLVHDVLTAYAQLSRGQGVSWPCRTMQFCEYARLQRSMHETWLKQHGAYWEQRMQGCSRTKFPKCDRIPSGNGIGWGTALIRIDKRLETQLRHWCRANATTVPMAVFTAYVGLVLRWCNIAETVVQFQSDGRSLPGAENAIGSFACSIYLRVHMLEEDDFFTLLERVTHEFCAAYEHQDFSFLAAQNPPPGWTRNTVFNWMPAGPGIPAAELGESAGAIIASPVHFPNPWLENLTWDNEPTTALFEGEAGIAGSVHFARHEHSAHEMERFVRAFLSCLEQLVARPGMRIGEIPLPGASCAM